MNKIEISAYSLDEAKLMAFQQGITVVYDATRSWKKAGSPILTKELNIYVADFLESHQMLGFKGAGIIITLDPGIQNTKKNPLRVENFHRIGRCKLNRTVEIHKCSDNTLIDVQPNKTAAINSAKELIKEYKEDLYAKTVYQSEDLDFKIFYNPSPKTRKGRYLVFSVDDSDVRLHKRKLRGFE